MAASPSSLAAVAPAQPTERIDRLPFAKGRVLAIGIAGVFCVRVSEQFAPVDIGDIQAGMFSTPDEASWILTTYTMASFAGIVSSVPLIRALSLGRYLAAISVLFAITSWACALAPGLDVTIAMRAIQGFASGGFGPAAFVAVFMIAGGPRLPPLASLLAFALLFPITSGPVLAGFIENAFGWQSLFLFQGGIGASLAFAAAAWVPRQAPVWSALKIDWTAVVLLSLALALLTLVFSQGTRRFWFESDIIFWSTCASIGALVGFIFVARYSPLPIMTGATLLTRRFGVPNALNLVLRATLVVTTYLVPQFLVVVQSYRPLEIGKIMVWPMLSQLLVLPLVWQLMQWIDARWVMVLGILLSAMGTALVLDGTSAAAAEQFRFPLVLFAAGQLLFLVPAVVVGTGSLKPADLPTASLAFNVTTIGGAVLGSGLVSHLVTEREKFHSIVITESVSWYDPLDAERIAKLAVYLEPRAADEAGVLARAISHVSSDARREAWVLAFNDAFLVITAVLVICAFGVIAMGRSEPLGRRASTTSGEQP